MKENWVIVSIYAISQKLAALAEKGEKTKKTDHISLVLTNKDSKIITLFDIPILLAGSRPSPIP